jgi:hypothetical protein
MKYSIATAVFTMLFFSSASKGAQLAFDVNLSYGKDYEDPSSRIPVFIYEYVFTNTSTTEIYSFSIWGSQAGLVQIESLSPPSSARARPTRRSLGMRMGPTKEQLITLKPGQSHKMKSWYWAKQDLPWLDKELKGYDLDKEGPRDLVLCADLQDDSAAFSSLGIKKKKLLKTRLCSKPIHFNFKFYSAEGLD